MNIDPTQAASQGENERNTTTEISRYGAQLKLKIASLRIRASRSASRFTIAV
jgi:hypothetical protein